MDEVGDGYGAQAAAAEARIHTAQAALAKAWPDVRDVVAQSAEYVVCGRGGGRGGRGRGRSPAQRRAARRQTALMVAMPGRVVACDV